MVEFVWNLKCLLLLSYLLSIYVFCVDVRFRRALHRDTRELGLGSTQLARYVIRNHILALKQKRPGCNRSATFLTQVQSGSTLAAS